MPFYDDLAPYYKRLYEDWEASVERQAAALESIIQEYFTGARSILDAACGIGTQTFGLATLGYQLAASDLSAGEIQQAEQEAQQRGLTIPFSVADMRLIDQQHPTNSFDVVIACDNAVPHLLSDEDILTAFRAFHQVARQGCMISVRDYAAMTEEIQRGGTKFYPRKVRQDAQGRVVIFDIWQFEGSQYEMTTYIIQENGVDAPQTQAIRGGRYSCVTLDTLQKLMLQAGFQSVEILTDRFFQPILVGKK